MLIIAVIVSVSIGITKAKLDNVISYTYYNAYSTLREITRKMLADWDPTDPEYKQQALNSNDAFSSQTKLSLHDSFIKSVLEFPNDHRFFSTLISHVPFSIKFNSEKVRAGNTVTVYGCASSAKYYDGILGATEKEESNLDYYLKERACLNTTMRSVLYDDYYIKCPGTYKSLATYATRGSDARPYYHCTRECSDLYQCDKFYAEPTGTCRCGLRTGYYGYTCSGANRMFSSNVFGSDDNKYLGDTSISSATVISSTLTTGNVCKFQIQCKDGYYWESKGSNYGYPVGSCKYCSKSCSLGFTLNKSTCSCECTKKCSEGYTLNTSKCTCVKNAGDGACNKTCSSGQKLDPDACKCKYECWNGSLVDYSFQCPSKVTCWDGSYATSQDKCPACTNKPSTIACGYKWDETKCKLTGSDKKCYGTGQVLDPSTCECYAPCWDGSREEYSWQCPSKVTCWDGSYAHNKSECPACTNKPATIPCGQSWDDEDCKITGSKKTCSSYSAPNLNPTTCECYANCWDGTTANYSWNCPTKYTCWDGSFVHNSSECPPCTKTSSRGYYLDSFSCSCI